MSRRMKKNRRVLSFALAFVMLVSLLPLSAVFSALAAGDEDADISVVMTADKETCSLDETAEVTINAGIKDTIQEATVTIHFDENEAALIQNETWPEDAFTQNESGGYDLTFTLDRSSNSTSYHATFEVAAPTEDTELPFTFEISDDQYGPNCDIDVSSVPADNTNTDTDEGTDSTESEDPQAPSDIPADQNTDEEIDAPSDTPEQTGDEPTDVEETPDENESTDAEETPDENEPTNEDVVPQVKGVSYLVSDQDTSEPSEKPFVPKLHLQGVTIVFEDQPEIPEEPAEDLDFYVSSLSTSVDKVTGITPIDRKLSDFTVDVTTSLTEETTVPKAGGSYTFYLQIALPEDVDESALPADLVSLANNMDGATLGEIDCEGKTLTIPVTQEVDAPEQPTEPTEPTEPVEPTEPEPQTWTYTFNIKANQLPQLSDTFAGGDITVNVVDADGQTVTGASAQKIEVKPVSVETKFTVTAEENLTQTISWVDNNDQDQTRPDDEDFPRPYLYFKKDDGDWKELTWDDLSGLGLKQMPELKVTTGEGGIGALTYKGLPTEIQITHETTEAVSEIHTIQWSFSPDGPDGAVTPPGVGGYQAEVSVDGKIWYYVQLTSFDFTVQLRRGTMEQTHGVQEATKENFALYQDGTNIGTLKYFEDQNRLTVETGGGPDPENNPTTGDLSVTGLPKYKLNGDLINYCLDTKENPTVDPAESEAMKLHLSSISDLEGYKNDYLQAQFDNSSQANHTKDDPELLAGGTLYLTLTGTTGFTATKEWKDEAVVDKTQRPTVTFQLYRYREDSDFHSASPVYGSDNNVVMAEQEKVQDQDGNPISDTYTLSIPDNALPLPKYDPDGYRYVYFLKETMSGGTVNYEQVFGRLDENGEIEADTDAYPGGKRPTDSNGNVTDTGIYNEGVVTNRPSQNATVRLSKVWEASAFQGMLEDVKVEFTLQWRDSGSTDDSAWTDVVPETTRKQTGITEENMNFDASATVSAYGPDGQLMEFRWVESGVYQGKDRTKNLLESVDGSDTEKKFTLNHGTDENPQYVTYISEAKTKNNETTITNSISATLDYTAIKEWRGVEPSEIKLNLYRYFSGEALSDNADPYLSLTWDGKSTFTVTTSEDSQKDGYDTGNVYYEGENQFHVDQNKPNTDDTTWTTIFHDLPLYDEHGREYEYLLLEDVTGKDHFPNYETVRDGNDYETTVINTEGPGVRILIRKEWTDDSDSAHRGPVTVQVYLKDKNEPLLVNGGPSSEVILEDGVWTVEVGLKDVTQDDLKNGNIYILETSVGGHDVPLSPYTFDQAENGVSPQNETTGGNPLGTNNVYQYETDHHRYEATYSKINLSGQDIFVVNNRRLGTVDLTAAKVWQDGTGTLREALNEAFKELGITAYLELSFAEGSEAEDHEIWTAEENKGYVTLGSTNTPIMDDKGTKHVSHRQEITMDGSENQETFHFFNLPKYDMTGAVVHYEVNEVWYQKTDSGEKKIETKEELNGALKAYSGYENDLETLMGQFSVSVTGDYKADPDTPDETGIQNDVQTVTVTNRLGDTKTVSWTKHWKDDYTFNQSQRPDIYLDIYRVTYDKDADGTKTVRSAKLYRHDYLWTPNRTSYDEGVSYTYDANNWTVTMSDVDQYDGEGYEYFYYAVERTRVNAGEYDYDYAQYSYTRGFDTIPLGDRNQLSYGAENKENEDGAPLILTMKDDGEVEKEIEDSVDSYPNYALLEGGEITNSISDTVTIEGRKLWKNTPGGFSDEHLPAVTFALYQYVQGEGSSENAEKVATLTVSEWADKNVDGTYSFTFEYLDDNNNPTLFSESLPRYNDEGKLYIYELREKTIEYADDIGKTELFKFNYDNNTYLIENAYNSPKGELYVRKHLALPTDLGASADGGSTTFPSIQFVLTRSYSVKGADGAVTTVEDKQFKETETWSWQEVKEAYQAAKDSGSGDDFVWLNEVLTFKGNDDKGLELYAPNGSKYVYTVTEKRDDFLYGYETTAQIGYYKNVDAIKGTTTSENGEPQVTGLYPKEVTETPDSGEKEPFGTTNDTYWATFKNVPVQSTIQITGTKKWEDFDNAFNLRPTQGEFKLTLYRSAAAQSTGGNAILEEEVPTTEYMFMWDSDTGGKDTWSYTITGPEGSNGLEAYAPNGMPWKYTVKETLADGLDQIYSADPSTSVSATVKEDENGEAQDVTMPVLKNSTEASVPYSKVWKDQDGNTITEDYLGKDVSVTFQVQVRPKGYNEWTDADEYFAEVLDDEAYNQFFSNDSDKFVRTVPGSLGGSGWSGSFTGLPKAILRDNAPDTGAGDTRAVDPSKFLFLEYRVVETAVTIGGTPIEVPVENSSTSDATPYDGYTPAGNSILKDVTFTKTGNVTTNKLKLQSLTIHKVWADGNNQYGTRPTPGSALQWLVSFVVQQKDGEKWVTVKDPANQSQDLVITLSSNTNGNKQSTTISGLPLREYQVRELQPDWKRDDNRAVSSEYFVEDSFYNGTYATEYKEDDGAYTVTNTLEVIPDTGNITVTKKWYAPEGTEIPDSIIVTLQRRIKDSGADWEDYLDPVTLRAENNWTHIWTGLPNFTNEGEELEYQVTEPVQTDGFLLFNRDSAQSGNHWEFVNVSTTKLTVNKTWIGGTPLADSIQIELWATLNGTNYRVEKGGAVVTATLDEMNGWSHTFDNLPAYDEDGNPYTYYARETTTGNFAAAYENGTADDGTFTTHIVNTSKTSISGTKTWVGTGDRNGIELNLERSTDGRNWTVISRSPTWTNRDDTNDTWNYTFSNLPATDVKGNRYHYRVTESPLDGYDTVVNGSNFTNVAEGSLTVSKVLSGGGAESGRDFHFTVTLTGVSTSGTKAEDFNETLGNVTFVNGVGSFTLRGGQSITIEGLPAGLDYTVEETDANQNGYTTSDNGNTQGEIPAGGSVYVQFTNYKPGSGGGGGDDDTDVDVEKRWVSHGSGTKSGSVTVQLLRNGQPYDTVELSEDNGWSYDWDSLDPQYDWSVREVNVTRGFSDHTSRTGGSYTITNEDAPPIEDIPDDPTPSTDIPDDPTPSTDVPEDPDVPDEPDEPGTPDQPDEPETPDSPKTDDPTRSELWALLCLASLAGMALLGASMAWSRHGKRGGKRLK